MAQSIPKRLAIHFQRYGPYHKARLASARQQLSAIGWQAIGLETASQDAVYQWQHENHAQSDGIHTVFPGRIVEQIPKQETQQGIHQALNQLSPDAIAIAGWSSADAIACLTWCRRHKRIALLMSETRAADGVRFWPKELLKGWRIKRFTSALVGGRSHASYLIELGFCGPIARGYDAIDNELFRTESNKWRTIDLCAGNQIRPYLLASSRFVERKNLIRLVQAFAEVAGPCQSRPDVTLDLCLVGDGPERPALQSICNSLDLTMVELAPWELACSPDSTMLKSRVFLPGFRQIAELPRFYAHACCFVHPAISEPWGLVMNEAMACGLPLLASRNCGAAEELVFHGVNGFLFDPLDSSALAACLHTFLNLTPEAQANMGTASAQILERLYPITAFGAGLLKLLGSPSLA